MKLSAPMRAVLKNISEGRIARAGLSGSVVGTVGALRRRKLIRPANDFGWKLTEAGEAEARAPGWTPRKPYGMARCAE